MLKSYIFLTYIHHRLNDYYQCNCIILKLLFYALNRQADVSVQTEQTRTKYFNVQLYCIVHIASFHCPEQHELGENYFITQSFTVLGFFSK